MAEWTTPPIYPAMVAITRNANGFASKYPNSFLLFLPTLTQFQNEQ